MNATARLAKNNNTPLVFKNHVPVKVMIDQLRDIQELSERGADSLAEQQFRHFCLAHEWNVCIDSGLSRWQNTMRITFIMTINGWMMKGTTAIPLENEQEIVNARAFLIHDCAQWLIDILG